MSRHSAMRILTVLTAMVLALCAPAQAANVNLNGVTAIPNQELYFRSGPNTAYTELYAMPQDTEIVALEIEEGNGVPWVLCEFTRNGSRVRGYTGLKRLDLLGEIPYAQHENLVRELVEDAVVYAAPDMNCEVWDTLPAGESVTLLAYEGDYCLIDYAAGESLGRGYIRQEAFMFDLEYVDEMPEGDTMTFYVSVESANFYVEPDTGSAVLATLPFDTSVTVAFSETDSAPMGWFPVYYGGHRGYMSDREINDLRFDSPEDARALMGY